MKMRAFSNIVSPEQVAHRKEKQFTGTGTETEI
jgi:hypothetical protein